jgi:hypothetical protein
VTLMGVSIRLAVFVLLVDGCSGYSIDRRLAPMFLGRSSFKA